MAPLRNIVFLVVLMPFASVADDVLTIAVASNFQSTAREIATEFMQETGVTVRMSSASTGILYAQIVNGAPFDVFLAADTERPDLLVQQGLATPDSMATYAIGQLVLWSSDPQIDAGNCRAIFERGEFTRLAVANPRTAPYGRAAVGFLESEGLSGALADKLVFGENIAQAFQFVATGNARFGLVARSQADAVNTPVGTCREPVDGVEIAQAGLALAASKNQQAAKEFMQFLRSPAIQLLLQQRGYRVPTDRQSDSS